MIAMTTRPAPPNARSPIAIAMAVVSPWVWARIRTSSPTLNAPLAWVTRSLHQELVFPFLEAISLNGVDAEVEVPVGMHRIMGGAKANARRQVDAKVERQLDFCRESRQLAVPHLTVPV